MAYTYGNTQNAAERIKEISGVNPLKCMKCGKCSATCPAFNEMDIPLLLCMCRTLSKRC